MEPIIVYGFRSFQFANGKSCSENATEEPQSVDLAQSAPKYMTKWRLKVRDLLWWRKSYFLYTSTSGLVNSLSCPKKKKLKKIHFLFIHQSSFFVKNFGSSRKTKENFTQTEQPNTPPYSSAPLHTSHQCITGSSPTRIRSQNIFQERRRKVRTTSIFQSETPDNGWGHFTAPCPGLFWPLHTRHYVPAALIFHSSHMEVRKEIGQGRGLTHHADHSLQKPGDETILGV